MLAKKKKRERERFIIEVLCDCKSIKKEYFYNSLQIVTIWDGFVFYILFGWENSEVKIISKNESLTEILNFKSCLLIIKINPDSKIKWVFHISNNICILGYELTLHFSVQCFTYVRWKLETDHFSGNFLGFLCV